MERLLVTQGSLWACHLRYWITDDASVFFSVPGPDPSPQTRCSNVPCGVAARDLVKCRCLNPLAFLDDSVIQDEFAGVIDDKKEKNAVLIGLSPQSFHYNKLNEAFRILKGPNPPMLIAIHKGRYYERNDGLAIGPGAFVAALEFSTKVSSEVVGKPSPAFFETALKSLQATPEECAMIGDDLLDDVLGAQQLGIAAVLVRTGKFRPQDEIAKPGQPAPDLIVDNFTAFVKLLLDAKEMP